MEQKAGAQISTKAFVQSLVILFVFMLVAGVLTQIIPAGSYTRTILAGRQVIDPQSFQTVAQPNYPIWRWFTAPVEVLWGPDGITIITIIIFLLMVGGSFAVLDQSGILKAAIGRLMRAFGGRKYGLLLVIAFFFMLLGAFFGIFEEVVPLVPVMLALAYYLGWDSLVGLGMSILATNLGFSAAITNPFTLGVAQKLAGLPLFSGAWLRIPIFIALYAVLAIFLVSYARKIDRNPLGHCSQHSTHPDGREHQIHCGARRHHGYHLAQRFLCFFTGQSFRGGVDGVFACFAHRVLCRFWLGQGIPLDADSAAFGRSRRRDPPGHSDGVLLRRWVLQPRPSYESCALDLPGPHSGKLPQVAPLDAQAVARCVSDHCCFSGAGSGNSLRAILRGWQ